MRTCPGSERYLDTGNQYCPLNRSKDLTIWVSVTCDWCGGVGFSGGRASERTCELCGGEGSYMEHPCLDCGAYEGGGVA